MGYSESADSSSQERLNQVIAKYLEAVEGGKASDRQEVLDCHPNLAEELKSFFTRHDKMKELAEPQGAGTWSTVPVCPFCLLMPATVTASVITGAQEMEYSFRFQNIPL